MKHWSESFHEQLRETHHPNQVDLFQELGIAPPYRPGVRCKICALPWDGSDARSSPAKARERRVWWVSNRRAHCPKCHQEKAK